jgi:hypothetical protein
MDFMGKSSRDLKLSSGNFKPSRIRDCEYACFPKIQNPGSVPQLYSIVQAEEGDFRRPIIPRKEPALEANQADERPLMQRLNSRIARSAMEVEQSSIHLSSTIIVSRLISVNSGKHFRLLSCNHARAFLSTP